MSDINFEEDVVDKIDLSDVNVRVIATLAQKQVELELAISCDEENLKARKKELQKIQEDELPNAMLEAGVSELKLANGDKVTIKKDIYPSIPKPKMLLAYSWLRENNFGAIIKNNITVQFGVGEDERATDLLTLLMTEGYDSVQKESVHPGTLKSFVKEQLADPDTQDLPEALFTVFEKSKAVVKLS